MPIWLNFSNVRRTQVVLERKPSEKFKRAHKDSEDKIFLPPLYGSLKSVSQPAWNDAFELNDDSTTRRKDWLLS